MAEAAQAGIYKTITPQSARQMITNLSTYTVILDVRRPDEFRLEHIRGAVNLPLGKLDESIKKVLPDMSQEIIVYCNSGSRSLDAAYQLINMGYKNVYDLGSITEWCFEKER